MALFSKQNGENEDVTNKVSVETTAEKVKQQQ